MNMFEKLLEFIENVAVLDFEDASDRLIHFVDNCEDFLRILTQIGTIPESIEHDSTQEKLFSKASDAVLARAFREIGLKAQVLKERGDSADVLAVSQYHEYSLVADSKAFRLSRTAKNQKDFKVVALSAWRKDSDYAILCAPYFQYPSKSSQVYAQAVDNNVCILSWEHLIFLIENRVKETPMINLSALWNVSGEYARQCVVANKKACFMPVVDKVVETLAGLDTDVFSQFLASIRGSIQMRAQNEISFWNEQIKVIQSYSREEAIEELIKARKINEKIEQIRKFISGLRV